MREFNFGPRPFVIVGRFGSGKKSVLKLACNIRGIKNKFISNLDKTLEDEIKSIYKTAIFESILMIYEGSFNLEIQRHIHLVMKGDVLNTYFNDEDLHNLVENYKLSVD